MPAVDLAPFMDTPMWKSWDEPKRAAGKKLWESKDTSDDDRALMLQKMQGPQQAAPVAAHRHSRASPTAGVGAWAAALSAGDG